MLADSFRICTEAVHVSAVSRASFDVSYDAIGPDMHAAFDAPHALTRFLQIAQATPEILRVHSKLRGASQRVPRRTLLSVPARWKQISNLLKDACSPHRQRSRCQINWRKSVSLVRKAEVSLLLGMLSAAHLASRFVEIDLRKAGLHPKRVKCREHEQHGFHNFAFPGVRRSEALSLNIKAAGVTSARQHP